jgi:hypothetical protein
MPSSTPFKECRAPEGQKQAYHFSQLSTNKANFRHLPVLRSRYFFEWVWRGRDEKFRTVEKSDTVPGVQKLQSTCFWIFTFLQKWLKGFGPPLNVLRIFQVVPSSLDGGLHFRAPLPSEMGTTQNAATTFALKPRPESGLDCLVCATFARQRPACSIRAR